MLGLSRIWATWRRHFWTAVISVVLSFALVWLSLFFLLEYVADSLDEGVERLNACQAVYSSEKDVDQWITCVHDVISDED